MNAPKINSIAIIRLSALGDIVHAIPAFNVLRQRFPNAHICWFAEPAGARLLENIDGIDEIIVTRLKAEGTLTRLKELKNLLAQHRKRFDVVLDFQGLIKSAVLTRLLKGVSFGFHKKNLREPLARYFYKRRAPFLDNPHHVIHKNIHLVNQLAEPQESQATEIAYPLKPFKDSKNLDAFLKEYQMEEKKYIILNVGGGWESKVLSPQQLTTIVQKLQPKHAIALLWGTEKEKQTALGISSQTGVPLTPFFTFSELIQFTRRASVMISADTLALHIADMVNTPSVGIFGPTSPWRNGSLLESSIHVFEKMPCGFCYKRKCDTIECIKKINIDKIIQSVEHII